MKTTQKQQRDGLGGDCTRVRAHLTIAVLGSLGLPQIELKFVLFTKVTHEKHQEELPKQQTHSQTCTFETPNQSLIDAPTVDISTNPRGAHCNAQDSAVDTSVLTNARGSRDWK